MRHINGAYTQAFNRRHGLVRHLLQGRFKAILVDRDAYLLALCRYVERSQREVPKSQRRIELKWADWLVRASHARDRALYLAYRLGAWMMTVLAQKAALSVSHVSRAIARVEREEKGET